MFYYHRTLQSNAFAKATGKASVHNTGSTSKDYFLYCFTLYSLELQSHPAFGCTGNLNAIVQKYDVVLCSPSVETGVSVDVRGHFTGGVWGMFSGVIPVDSAAQALARVREPVERHIFAPTRGVGQIGRGETSARAILETEDKLSRLKLHQVYDAALGDGEIDTNFLEAACQCWARMAARINAGINQHAESLLSKLTQEGHIIAGRSSIDKELRKQLSEEMTTARDANQQAIGEAIAAARDLTKEQAEQLEGQSKSSEADQLALAKFKLKERYAVQPTPDLYLKDCDGFHAAIRLHYYLSEGKQYLKERDRARRDDLVDGSQVWMFDLNRSLISDQVRVLEYFGILDWVEKHSEGFITATDDDLQQLLAKVASHQQDIKAILGFSPSDSEILLAKQFLGKIGLTLRCAGKRGCRGAQQRVYQLVSAFIDTEDEPAIDDGRQQIFAAWTERHEQRRAKAAEAAGSPAQNAKVYRCDTVSTSSDRSIQGNVDTATEEVDTKTADPNPPSPAGQGQAGEAAEPRRYRWRGRLGEWLVDSIDGAIAKVASVAGWAAGYRVWGSAPIDELEAIP